MSRRRHILPRDPQVAVRAKTPSQIPLEDWPKGWLSIEVSSLLNSPNYMLMYEEEKRSAGLPVTEDEMRAFIKERRTQ